MDGARIVDQQQLERAFTSYFLNMFSSSNPSLETIDNVLQDLSAKVTTTMNERLLAPFTRCEIERAIKQMHPSKAPGPDGFLLFFIKSSRQR